MTKRMTKALATGMTDAMSGLMMRRSDSAVPKTRKMRIALAISEGMGDQRVTVRSEKMTMARSKIFHPEVKNGRHQWA